tara:strand:- start:14797 stop:16032 length:1236 start_codon:yes stop_codon:yes gene_type:complete
MQEKYLYITDSYSNTVTDSQVVNKIQLLDDQKIHFDLIIVSPLYYLIRNYKENKKNISYAQNNIEGNVFQVPILKSNDPTGFSSFIKFCFLLFFLFSQRRKKITIQTRSIRDFKALQLIKVFFNQIRIIFDFRGVVSEEYINSLGYTHINEVKKNSVIKKYNRLLLTQSKMYNLSDKIFCVSNMMKEYVTKYSQNAKEIIVIPGAADSNQFYFDKELRYKIRKDNDISPNDKVIVYCGRLDSFYCVKEDVFLIIGEILKLDCHFKFLCLTPDLKSANLLIKKNNLNINQVILKHIPYDDVNSYLNASDYALLIRQNIQTNFVSSPTKVAEYLLCGLPIIISKKVGDFSKYISDNNFGIVIDSDITKFIELFRSKIKFLDKINRKELSLKSALNYSKQAYSEKLTKFYKNYN